MTGLTLKAIEALAPGETLRDGEIPGLEARKRHTGRTSFILYYHLIGKRKSAALGKLDEITVTEARDKARLWRSLAAQGTDPRYGATKHSPAVRELAGKYLDEHGPRKKQRSLEEDTRILDTYILPRFGDDTVGKLERGAVASWHAGMSKTPYQANRALALLSKMFSLAELWGWRAQGTNPAQGVSRFREKGRKRYLTPDEIKLLTDSLDVADRMPGIEGDVADMIRILIFTGARSSEIRTARWSELDIEGGRFNLEDSKTGERTIIVPDPAMVVLERRLESRNGDFIFPGSDPAGPLIGFRKPWIAIRDRSGIENVRPNDLRHTFASYTVSAGSSLAVVGGLLGHTNPKTTARYAHLFDDPLKSSAKSTAEAIAHNMR